MSLPEGVTTAVVTAGVPVTHTGAPVKAFLSIEPSVFLVHTATGTPLVDFLEELSINEGVAGQFTLPHTDQAGFQDENGNAYTNWYYTARISYSTPSKAKTKAPKIKVFQLAAGQTVVDLDSLPGGAPALPYVAPIATVTSVNGRTGPVTIEDADLPARLSDASLTATILDQVAAPIATAVRAAQPIYTGEVPSYAGARPHSFERSTAVYNGESKELADIRRIIATGKRGTNRVRVALPGDSRTRGAGVPTVSGQQDWGTYSLPAQFKDLLAAREGDIYFDPKDKRFSAIAGATFDANVNVNQMLTTLNVATSITVTLPACTGFDLWLFRTGTTEVATITVDGGAAETYAPGAGATWKRFEKRGLTDATHTVTITVPALTAGSFSFSRIAPYHALGLTVTNAGRSSSAPADWASTTWNRLLPTIIGTNAYIPDVVFLQIGTNWGTSTYADLQSIVTQLRAAGSKVGIISFGPRTEDQTDPVFNTRRGYLYDLADEFDLPLLDNLQVIGPWSVANGRGLFNDTVHEKIGGLALEAAALARMLG